MSAREQAVADAVKKKLPKHVAIIMDGNGRWAKERGLPRIAGHWSGAEALRRILEYCSEIGIEVLTVFAFSSENWKRPWREVKAILNLLIYYLKIEIDNLYKNNVKVVVSGNWRELPPRVSKEIEKCIEKTRDNTGITLNIALNYGSRKEIVMAAKNLCQSVLKGNIKLEDVDEKTFESFLYTSTLPDPDLVIRPSGELRLSNFLLWQIAYSELWFTETYWPDFTADHMAQALEEYLKRERRYGGIKQENR